MFGILKKTLGAAAKEVKAEYGESKDFLEAICAASALVAASDGDIEESERRKVVSIISNHPTLSKLYQSNIIEQTADTMFKRAKDVSGRQQLARELDDIKSRPDGSQMAEDVYLIALDIANSDGEIEPQEDAVLKKIAARLGIDASKFDF
ncbi:tellurite resistance TerB family protein [Phyllobacterium leguminum]|uniref:Tellurite resistance protein TerB n=1 Tax=Phyllobacterium leguminum TaxID=314237 RepID=A0A318T436_9HYPH|nr:TerB family tellurite resistance protein [Phyllobacterium leguminum]PYE89633.1 tellurite resistance protein TerB [Phyllobacterium leguminum]